MNYHIIAEGMSSLDRNAVQLGLEEMVTEIYKVLEAKSRVKLLIQGVCQLVIASGKILPLFDQAFVSEINAPTKPASSKAPSLMSSKASTRANTVRVTETRTAAQPQAVKPEDPVEKGESSEDDFPLESIPPITANTTDSDDLQTSPTPAESEPVDSACSTSRSLDLSRIEEAFPVLGNAIRETKGRLGESVSTISVYEQDGKHRHSFTGDRLWSNSHCPICRQEASKTAEKDIEHIHRIEAKIFSHLAKRQQQQRKTGDVSEHRNAPRQN